MNDDYKGEFQTVLVLLQCQDECNVSLKSIKVTLHLQDSTGELLNWLKAEFLTSVITLSW